MSWAPTRPVSPRTGLRPTAVHRTIDRELAGGPIRGGGDVARKTRRELVLYTIGLGAVIAAVAVAGQGGNEVDNEVWRWLWTIFAIVMGIGEIFTAGFFLLPFAIGAASAAILAWAGTGILAQWLVFFGVSIVSLAYLRRFITRQDEAEQPKVGANRWVGAEGIVLEAIDPHTGAGMVRVATEEWRATATAADRQGRPNHRQRGARGPIRGRPAGKRVSFEK